MRLLKEKSFFIWGLILLVLLLSSCGTKNEIENGNIVSKDTVQSTLNYEFLEEQDLIWKDNSLDEWQAVFNLPIEEVKDENEWNGGIIKYFAEENGAVRFKTHILGNYKKSWSGVNGFSTSGEKFSGTVRVDDEHLGEQIHFLGPIAGGSGYVACRFDYDEKNNIVGQHYYTLDGRFEKVSETEGKKPINTYFYRIVGDNKGYYHILSDIGHYIILSPDGETIFEMNANGWYYPEIYALEDGRVIICQSYENSNNMHEGWKIIEANIDLGATKEIVKLNQTDVGLARAKLTPLLTMNSANEVVCCDSSGIYLYNPKDKQRKVIYRWSRHGIHLEDLWSIYAKADGTIGVIYEDKEGKRYILLKPKFEEVEVKTIEFAVAPRHQGIYREAVATFNRKYPTYNIELRDDYEETPLFTKLGSGEGPVLVDTELTGFEALQKLWQPLDGYIEKSGLAKDLYPQALEFGRIGDNNYGIVTSFYIETLVAKNRNLCGWDYDAYLDAVENFDGSVFTYEYVFEPTDYRKTFLNSLSNGLNDSAYFDAEKGTVVFGTPYFKRILSLTEKANPCLPFDEGKVLQEDRALCEMVHIDNVRRLLRLRMRLESGEIVNVGYPTKEGGKPLLVADSPITVRSTATDEEKQMAYTFFKILLSHDSVVGAVTDNIALYTSNFSVRKEILEKQFDQHNQIHEYNDDPEIDKKKERALFEELLENAVVKKSFPADLQSVFDEEFDEYLDGEIPADLLDSRLRSRVGLYLDER